jgi:galactokinase
VIPTRSAVSGLSLRRSSVRFRIWLVTPPVNCASFQPLSFYATVAREMSTIDSLRNERTLTRLVEDNLPGCEVGRFRALVDRLERETPTGPGDPVRLASAPGRTELAGNHTDHNHGKVLAASISLDSIAAFSRRDDMHARFLSAGFAGVDVDLTDLSVVPDEAGTVASLVRGVAAGFEKHGLRIGGFNACASSLVLGGSGLSSSASIEILLGTILNELYNDASVGPTTLAIAGKFAENVHFGKPSGLMDQLACATGGIIAIDFARPETPVVERIETSFAKAGLSLLVVDTGAGHADLTDQYAAIPRDMRRVAAALGKQVLREVEVARFYDELPRLREELDDRAVARAVHYFEENDRVDRMAAALRAGRVDDYLALMADSGRSSGMFLQNCAPEGSKAEQSVVIALALSERFFSREGMRVGRDGACRVHGGGFAGTIQLLLPASHVDRYQTYMEQWYSKNAVSELSIRTNGALSFHG